MSKKEKTRNKANEISEKIISVRISNAEFEELEKKMAKLKINTVSDYLRSIILDKEIKIKEVYEEDPEKLELLRDLIYQIRMIGLNINQIAYGVNVGMSVPEKFFPWAEEQIKEINSNCKNYLSELEKDFVVRDRL